MRTRLTVRALALVNGALLAAVVATALSRPAAVAQGEPATPDVRRPRGEYTMVSAKTNQGGPHAVWILDAANNEMVALRWDQSRQSMLGLGYRSISSDSRVSPGR